MADWVCQKFGREYTDEFQRVHGTKTYHVHLALPVDDLDLVLAAVGLPSLGDSYAPTPPPCYLRCASREVRELGNSRSEYEVVCSYDMDPYDNWSVKVNSQTVDYVLERTMAASNVGQIPARFAGDPARYLQSRPSGLAGEFIVNRAREPFDPPVMSQRHQSVITLSMLTHDITNTGFATVGSLMGTLGKVNDARVQIFSIPDESGAGCDYWTLLMDDVSVDKLLRPDGGCDILVTLRIIYDPLGHCQVVLNCGYNQLLTPAALRTPCKTDSQTEVSSPMPLDANGKQLAIGGLPASATYIVFPDHQTTGFAAFNFPATFCGISPTPAP